MAHRTMAGGDDPKSQSIPALYEGWEVEWCYCGAHAYAYRDFPSRIAADAFALQILAVSCNGQVRLTPYLEDPTGRRMYLAESLFLFH